MYIYICIYILHYIYVMFIYPGYTSWWYPKDHSARFSTWMHDKSAMIPMKLLRPRTLRCTPDMAHQLVLIRDKNPAPLSGILC